ncbi:hypothetical protein JK182_09585 [Acetobacter okinawensis]|uniref:hypothetical protein n=1 Tax=Acetobacter okinawensis TaxID=1076594 RepID=UPI001BA812AC|nr:hypothetical protein [Acetobacter okinawensis]MBS0988912.1 hypothetical protein [Acetobacter okinawensis]
MPVFNETSFTSWIVAALAEYLPEEKYAFTSHSRNQGLKDAWRRESCPDIFQPFNNGAALALEVKIATEEQDEARKLIHYKREQCDINQLLFEKGVPAHYCYNDIVQGIRRYRGKQFLEKCMCSEPRFLCDPNGTIGAAERKNHKSLDVLVDDLIGHATEETELARTLFNLIVNAAPVEPGARTLLLACNASTREVTSFDEDAQLFIKEKVVEFVAPEIDKSTLERLKNGKYKDGLIEYTPSDLSKLCDKFCNAFNRSLSEYMRKRELKQKLQDNNDKTTKPSGGDGGPKI